MPDKETNGIVNNGGTAADTMDVEVQGPLKRLGHRRVPEGHVGITLAFGAELVGGGRAESVTFVKPGPEMLTFLDRLRSAAVSELTS